MKSIPLDEQETTVNFCRTEQIMKVYTCDGTMITKLDKIAARCPDEVSVTEPDEYGRLYTLPKSFFSIRPPRKLSDEQRERLRTNSRMYGFGRTASQSDAKNQTTDCPR